MAPENLILRTIGAELIQQGLGWRTGVLLGAA
jgi:hypothetical protein